MEIGLVGRDAERGAPVLPSGLVGSISHTREVSIAIALRASGAVGIDIERNDPERPRLERRVLTTSEETRIACLPSMMRWRAVLAVFCAKEAAFKALDSGCTESPLTFRSLETSPTADGLLLVRVVATPHVRAEVAVEQNEDLTVAVASKT
jgi:4'-phosphopantetheinyl transferase EntD